MRKTLALLGLLCLVGCETTSNSSYQSDSPYAPNAQSRHDINQLSGTAEEKANAMRAVERFNKAAADRGERPTGL
jgi:hypothetical protein